MSIEILWVLLVCIPLLLERVWLRRRLATVTEERRKSEERLAYRHFISAEIAHDIKNPITAIICSAEALDLVAHQSLSESERQTLRSIRDYGEHLRRLVSDFLDISLVEAGKLTVHPSAVPLPQIVDSVAMLLRSTASAKAVVIETRSFGEELYGWIDGKHAKQIVFNLVHNAIKFAPERSVVSVSTTRGVTGEIRVSVADEGEGIPTELLPHVFTLWSAPEAHRKRMGGGVGIGLALVKHLVELAGGTISVVSTPGEGARFTVTVPAAPGHVLRESSSEKPLSGTKILWVGPHKNSYQCTGDIARELGAIVTATRGIEEALERLAATSFDAVVVGGGVESGLGLALSKIVKVDLGHTGTKVIVESDVDADDALSREFQVDQWCKGPMTSGSIIEALRTSRIEPS